jgi:hypothetical protein
MKILRTIVLALPFLCAPLALGCDKKEDKKDEKKDAGKKDGEKENAKKTEGSADAALEAKSGDASAKVTAEGVEAKSGDT